MIIERAYLEMYPEARLGDYDFSLKYSAKFNDYNANVRKLGKNVQFCLSRKWRKISDDIKMGLIHGLMNKIFNTKVQTLNMELYEIFLKKIHIAVPKTKTHPILEDSFSRINEVYFYGLIEQPNLQWGKNTTSKLGSYEYGSDTISISGILRNAPLELLDYVMYHEMLHKKHKFHTKNGKSYHHTGKFRKDEKKFRNHADAEKRISNFIGQFRRKRSFFGLF